MLELQDPNEEKKHFLDRNPEFWDRVIKRVFISGLSIILFVLILRWLGYFD